RACTRGRRDPDALRRQGRRLRLRLRLLLFLRDTAQAGRKVSRGVGARTAMRGNDEALDVALGLLRAPALRSALRRRPLPSGVGEVLAIASGSAEGARAAAERTGYETGEL